MFENLQEKLQRAFKTLRGQATLTEENIGEALREIRLALLEADVNFKVVKDLIDRIQAKAVGQSVMTALSPGEQVIKIVRDELVEVLGHDTAKLKFASQPPTVVLMAGLQGSGKTTTSGKLANWLKTGGHRPLLVSVDVYRPAAREQLKVVAQAIKANIYEGEVGEANTATVERLAKEARREAHHLRMRRAHRRHRRPSAHRRSADGRNAVAEAAAQSPGNSLRRRRHDRTRRRPLGRRVPQEAFAHRRRAHQNGWRCPRRRGAFHPPGHRDSPSSSSVSAKNTTRSNPSILTASSPASSAWATFFRSSRRRSNPSTKKKAQEMASRALTGDGFSLEDFRDQLRQVKKMGSIQSLMGMLPSVGPFSGLQKAADKVDEKQINRVEAIINSMTTHERMHHDVINGSRRKAHRPRLRHQRAGSEQSASPIRADEKDVQADRQGKLHAPHGGDEVAGNVAAGIFRK